MTELKNSDHPPNRGMKMGYYVTLEIELEVIENFLDENFELVDVELSSICKRDEAGEFPHPDDLSNALFVPIEREAIVIRAVFHEINALIEWELHNLALEPFSKSARHAKARKANRIKLVHDLSIGEVRQLVEEHYKIELSHLPGAIEIESIRKTVNAFKHRKGFKDPHRDSCSKIPERFEPDKDEAYKVIKGARDFLRALWEKTNFKH